MKEKEKEEEKKLGISSDDEKDRFKDCEEHDPNVLLMISMDRSKKENEERQKS